MNPKFVFYAIFIGIIWLLSVIFKNNDNNSKSHSNSELITNEFGKSSQQSSENVKSTEDRLVSDSIDLLSQGFKSKEVENGDSPDCFNYNPLYDRGIDNKLEVEVGKNTDVVIKLMSRSTDKCIRYFYINSNSTFIVRNIPEDNYYLKIAYGKSWMMSNGIGQCIGKFLRQAMYEKGQDELDFHLKQFSDSYSIPSYKLRLDVISNSPSNTFQSFSISEKEFNL